MLKRSLVFSSPANLSLKDRQIVISLKESPEDKITVPIEDIGVVVIDNPAVTITIPLLNNLLNSSSKCNGIHINNLFKFFVWCEVSKSFTRSII